MLRVLRSQVRPYAIAFLASAIALVLTRLIEPLMSPTVFALFYPAVMVSSLYGGLRSGLLAIALAALATKYFFLPPVNSLAFTSPNSLLRFTVLVLVALMISVLSTALRTAKQRTEVSLLRLRTSEEQYRRIVETSNEGIWLIDAETRTTYVNSQMAQMLGYSIEEMLGRSVLEFIYEADWAQAERLIERRRQGIAEQIDFCLRCKDGSRLWANTRVNSIMSDNGECLSMLAMVTDVSDAYPQAAQRKRTEQRQRVQYAVSRVLAEATTVADALPTILQSLCESLGWQVGTIWSVDRQVNVLRFVESWHASTVNVEEFAKANQHTTFTPGIGLPGRIWTTGQPIWISHLIEDDNFPRAALAARGGLRGALGFPILLEKEILGVIECFSDKIQEPDEDLLQMMASIGSQIGQFMERKRTEEELAQSQQLFLSFMNNIPGAAYIKDEQGGYLYANPAAERAANRKLVDILGKTDFDLLPAEAAQQLRDNDIAVLVLGKPVETIETVPQEDGEHYWMSFKFPFKDASGKQILAGMSFDISDRKQLEEALRDSEQRYRLLAEGLPQFVWTADSDGKTDYYNQHWYNYTGLTHEQALGDGWADVLHPDDRERTIARWQNAVARGEGYEIEYRFKRAVDGQYRWYFASIEAIRNSSGQIIKWVGSAIDIDDRKRTEEVLRENEQRLKLALETAKLGSWQLDLTTGVLSGSDQCKANLGLPPDADFSHQRFVAAIHPDDRDRVSKAGERAIAHQTDYEAEYRNIWPDGSIHWIVARGRGIYAPDSTPLRLVGVCLDITERKQAEVALRASENLYRTLSEAVPDFIWSCDAEGRADFVNSRWLEYTGMNLEELNAGGLEQVSYPEDLPQLMQRWDLARQKGDSFEAECRYRRKDGVYRWFMVRAVPLKDTTGNIVKWIGTTTDIHERKQTEQALRQSEERLRVALKNSPITVFNQDRELRYTWIYNNPDFGHRAEELIGKRDLDLRPPTEAEVLTKIKCQVLETGVARREEVKIAMQGQERFYDLTVEPLRDANHEVIGVTCAAVDISEHKQTEMALRKSETLLNALLACLPIGLAFLDRDLRYIHANEALAAINGLPLNEHLGRTLWDVLPEWAPQLAPIFQQVMQTKEALLNQEVTGETNPPGIHRHCLVNYYPVCLPDGQVLGVGVTSMDVTELKRVEQALRESESLFRRMADGAPVFIWMSGLDGHCTYFNQPWLDFVGQTLEEALTIGWPEGIHPDDKEYCLETYLSAFNARQRFQLEYRHRRQDGEYRWLLDEGVPLFNGDGSFAGYIGSGIDISDRKRTEQAQQYLSEASRVLSSSLDYQTTLTSIAQLTVPHLADWCTVHLVEDDGSVQPLATAHVNPAKVVWAKQINQKYPIDGNAPRGIAQVLRTGQSELYPDIPDHLVVEAARDAEHLQILREVGLKSVMIVPLLARGRALGTISFIAAESGRRYDQADQALAEELARRAALAVENARLYRQAQQARQRAEQAAECTARLQAVTAAFSEALTPAQVAEVVVNQGIAALGVSSGFVAVLTDHDTSLEIVESVGLPQEIIDSWKCFPVTAPVPMAEIVRTGEPIFLESVDAFVTQYPILAHVPVKTGNRAFACIPLTVEGRTLGGMSFSFADATRFSEEDRAFMLTLGHLCGQAIARARLYEAEQRARTDAETANRIKDEFLAVLSHELRSPLNPILGWTKLLRSRKFDAKATDHALEIIERNAKLQTQLIEDLLDVSRILRGKLVLNVAPVNLVTTIEAALETVHLAAQSKDIQIHTLLEPNVGQVSGDLNRLQQVVWNLLSNAVKFTPSGGRVEVRLEKVEQGLKVSRLQVEGSNTKIQPSNIQPSTQYAQIQVTDTGKGISPEFLPHVFEHFRQENSTTTRQFGGLGLGLAIVRYLTELHGGSVHAESPGEGLGATFTVRLPLMVAQQEATQEQVQLDCSADLGGLRVLVVDDEADIRELVAFILEQSGAEVTIAASAQEALVALKQSVPDVLLSDIGMPEVDGYMLMRQVRALSAERGGQVPALSEAMPKALRHEVQAIALTAYAGEYNQQQALQAGFQLHIAKPVEPEELVRAIARLVGRT